MISGSVQVPVDAWLGRIPRADVPQEHASRRAKSVLPAAARDSTPSDADALFEVLEVNHGTTRAAPKSSGLATRGSAKGLRKADSLARHAARQGFQATAQRLKGGWVVVARLPDSRLARSLAGVRDA